MSHVNTYKAKILNIEKFKEILESLNASQIKHGNHTFEQYGNNKVNCELSFMLPNWKYKIGVDASGNVLYDNWGSSQGSMENLGNAIQTYYKESILDNIDYTLVSDVEEYKLENGEVQLVVNYT